MQEKKIFIFGLDFGGKTTLLNFIKGSPNSDTIPTKKFNIAETILEDINFHIWDAPGQILYRKSWKKGLGNTDILMFVLDTSDSSRFKEAKDEFDKLLTDPQVRDAYLVICFHKMDKEEAKKNVSTAKNVFSLSKISNRKVYPIETSIHSTEQIDALKKMLVRLIIDSQKEFFKKQGQGF